MSTRAARWVVQGVVVALVALGSAAIPAYANNTHTVNTVYHGCGDCSGAYNYSIHPFTEKLSNYNFKRGQAYHRSAGPLGGLSGDCYCPHAHMTWDTNPTPECQYSGYSAAVNPNLNGHFHYFHGYSGYC